MPLAARMRPVSLDEFVGQEPLVGERGALRRAAERGHLPSMVLWGPPGSGKTTLARLLADTVGARFETISAVMAGVADIRRIVGEARTWLDGGGRPLVLFIDEIHRFNKAQQDALLPQVEDGTITLIGATTENPYFEVNNALLSRLRVFRLEPLSDEQLGLIVEHALTDARGLKGEVSLGPEALEHLVGISAGDARAALNVLENAVAIARADSPADSAAPVQPTVEAIEAAAQQRVLAYDRAGDGHYDTVSAYIKSLRGNDPDAALYWLATMVAAGEDPRFICRRLIISASEDVGNADPRALQVAVAAAQALEWVGLPEAQYALAQATAYVASAPKSNRAGQAYWAALADVQSRGSLAVPKHLRSGTWREKKDHGIGVGYRNPHDHPGADVAQQYLPDELAGQVYYQPSDQGMESQIAARLERIREARGGGDDGARPGQARMRKLDSMKVAGQAMRDRQDSLRRRAEQQRREAEGKS
jgi:putative ATPase